MALPPKGDVRRPLHLAVRSMRLLGIVLLALSMCVGVVLVLPVTAGNTRPSWVAFVVVGVYLVPGLLFLLCARQLRFGKSWAIVLGIVLSSFGAIVGLLLLVGTIVMLARQGLSSRESPALFIPMGLAILFVAAFAQLLVHLAQSFRALKHPEFLELEPRGFEPLLVKSVEPADPE